MNPCVFRMVFLFLAVFAFRATATTHFVNVNSTSPQSPYTSWAHAATNINDAINAAIPSDTILVTNGIYQTGGSSFPISSNRVYVSKAVLLQSVNGPSVTIIRGFQTASTNGSTAVRCVYLADGATLSGFTLTNGATAIGGNGGGVYTTGGGGTVIITNCYFLGNAAYSSGGGGYQGDYINCVFAGNVSFSFGGGGTYAAGAKNCLYINNRAPSNGGGAYNGGIDNCTFVGNYATSGGGGAYGGTLRNCILYYDLPSSASGADAYNVSLTYCCALNTNIIGGGGNNITNTPGFVDLANGNYRLQIGSPCINAGTNGAAPSGPDLDGNARISGGTVDMGAYENQFSGTAHFVDLNCTNPIAPYTNWLTAATNIQDAVASAQTGEFVVANDGIYTNGGTVIFGAETNRVALTNAITLLSLNGPQAATIVGGTQMRCAYVGSNAMLMGFTLTNGGTRNTGDFTNEQCGAGALCDNNGAISNCFIAGNFTTSITSLGAGIFGGVAYNCVISNNICNGNDGGAAASATLYNCLVVSNYCHEVCGGLYRGVASNCTFIGNSANHSNGGAYRCALFNCTFLQNSNGATYQSFLSNCVVTGNSTSANSLIAGGAYQCTNYYCTFSGNTGGGGGGVSGGVSYNCILTNNSAPLGGGASGATLYNCLLIKNFANDSGGADSCTLNNCTVVFNVATNTGGGVSSDGSGQINNSIIYYNSAPNSPNYSFVKFNFSCSFPSTLGIVTTSPPLFVNTNSNFRLLSNSPCINSGTNFYATNGIPFVAVDLDGNPRIVGSAADIGAYEFQSPASVLPSSWLWQYGLPTDGSADNADADGDGESNYTEWKSGTNPTNSTSVLAMKSPVATTTNATVTWKSVSGVKYFIQRGSDLSTTPVFTTIATNITGQAGTTSYTDTTATNSVPYFYRVGVP